MIHGACRGFFAHQPMGRREFLRAGAVPLLGLGLPELLAARERDASKGPLPPFVSMMPKVQGGAPRFVEQSHGQGAGWMGPLYEPLRIDADASKADYQVGEFALHAELPVDRTRRRQALLNRLDVQRRRL